MSFLCFLIYFKEVVSLTVKFKILKTHNLSLTNSLLHHFVMELRDIHLQNYGLRFRRNLERIGEILAYEMSKELNYATKVIDTPLGQKPMELIKDKLVLCSVLRAGIPLHQGVLNYFDWIENAFISAYRLHTSEEEFTIKVEYLAAPELNGKILILADPMLATGRSLVSVLDVLKTHGAPQQIHIISVIATQEGIDYVSKNFPENTQLWIAALDPELNQHGYIVPGLGDAGDLSFGPKL